MKKFVLSKKYWILAAVIIALAGSWFIFKPTSDMQEGVEMGVVSRGNIVEIVSETGFVLSSQEVELAFERGGKIAELPVEAGTQVRANDILIKLDASQQTADLNAAYARLDAEKIRLSELINGADDTSLAVTQTSVEAAKTALENAERNLSEVIAQQDQFVANAEKTLRSSDLEAYLISDEQAGVGASFDAPTVTGTYGHEEEGVYMIELYNSSAPSGASFRVWGLETDTRSVSTVNPVQVGTRGLYIQFPEDFASRTRWEIQIPNTRSQTYLSNLNAYNAVLDARDVAITAASNAVAAARAGVNQSQTQYTQVSQSARNEHIDAQRALIRQMEAAVEAAQVSLNNTVIYAPFDGIVTAVTGEIGEIVSPTAPVVAMMSLDNFEIAVNISESDIEEMNLGDTATVSFDAYDDISFKAEVRHIAPHAVIVDGVRVFEVKLRFTEQSELIRSGLSADIDILTATRENAIAVPSRSIAENENGKFVRSLANGKLQYLPVTVGLRGSDGQSEITGGLQEGQSIITFADSNALKQLESN